MLNRAEVPQAKPQVHVKATPVNGLVEFVKKELTPQQYQSVLDRLGPDGKLFTGKLLAHEQVDFHLTNRFTALAAEAKGEPVKSFGYRAGRYGAELGLKSVYKFMMMLMSIESVLQKAPFMWARVYDSGTMRVENTPTGAKIVVTNFPSEVPGCARITGWFEVIGQKAGAKNLKMSHVPCMAEGGTMCVWNFTFDK